MVRNLFVLIVFLIFTGQAFSQDFASNENAEKKGLFASKKKAPGQEEFVVSDESLSDNHYYLIVGVYEKHAEAKEFVHELKPRGFHAEIIYRQKDGVYLVHIPCYQTQEITWHHMNDVRNEFQNAWFQKLY